MVEEVERPRKPYRWLRWTLLGIFILSFSLSLLLVTGSEVVFDCETQGVDQDCPPLEPESSTAVTVTLVTSVTSLLGWISTTVLAWRKDRREARAAEADLELRRQALAIEKQKLGLEGDISPDEDNA